LKRNKKHPQKRVFLMFKDGVIGWNIFLSTKNINRVSKNGYMPVFDTRSIKIG